MFLSAIVAMATVAMTTAAGNGNPSEFQQYDAILPSYIQVELVADPLLERLSANLKNLEFRENSQLSQLSRANEEADRNVEFSNRFNMIIHQQFAFHQKVQDARLDELESRVAEIEALRQRVQDLQTEANGINDNINNDVYPARKLIMYDLDDLRNIALEFTSRLEETQQRADDVTDRIDELFRKSWDNSRKLDAVYVRVGALVREVNAQRVGGEVVNVGISPNSENNQIILPYNADLLGAPFFSTNTLTGFQLIKGDMHYDTAFPSLYFGVSAWDCTNRTTLRVSDMSTAGWTVEALFVSVAKVYISTEQLFLW